jgi:hypothetical protein
MKAHITLKAPRFTLLCWTALSLTMCIALAWFSRRFAFHTPGTSRPIALVVSLLITGSVFHLFALRRILSMPATTYLSRWILGVAVLMRVILLFSTPIQEVDIYRYIWDGIVAAQGVVPYRFAPVEITDLTNRPTNDSQLLRLRRLVQTNPGIAETARRVHFPELTTVYPPISQVVFATSAMLTPGHASVEQRVLGMKALLLVFDIATLCLIQYLLRSLRYHCAWLIPYAWSPLVLKEFANSGHLDSIAVAFTVATTTLILRIGTKPASKTNIAAAMMAGFAVGAKLFPIVLYPLWAVFLLKKNGVRVAALWSALATIAATLGVLPMLISSYDHRQREQVRTQHNQVELDGLTTFLSRWEMNDLLFMIVEENIRPVESPRNGNAYWFVIVPANWRESLINRLSRDLDTIPSRLPFLITRGLSLACGLLLTLGLCCVVWRTPSRLPEAIFLALAWLWFLAPTQNPWYWTWALAFVPFSRNRIWLGVSTLTLIYYLRFWFLYYFPTTSILGTSMSGSAFFDFAVVWLEFGPFLGLLLASSVWPGLRLHVNQYIEPIPMRTFTEVFLGSVPDHCKQSAPTTTS